MEACIIADDFTEEQMCLFASEFGAGIEQICIV